QLRVVFLKACVDAVVAHAGRVVRVEAEPGGGGLGTGRAGQPAVVEGDQHGAVRGCRQVGLQRIDARALVVVDLDGRGPVLAAVIRRAEDQVAEAGAVVLPRGVQRVGAGGQALRSDGKRVLDPIAEVGVR